MSFKSICVLGLIAILLAIPAIESRRRHSHRHSCRRRFSDEFMGRGLFYGGRGVGTRDDHRVTLYGRSDDDVGDWGEMEFCHPYHMANSAQLKVEKKWWDYDDSAVNGIRLGCPNAPNSYTISSAEGGYGEWKEKQNCPGGERIIGFERKFQSYRGVCPTPGEFPEDCDDTATNALRIICGDFKTGQRGDTLELEGRSWGDWEGELLCPPDTYVCGIRTQIDNDKAGSPDLDITGLNGVDMACCYYKF